MSRREVGTSSRSCVRKRTVKIFRGTASEILDEIATFEREQDEARNAERRRHELLQREEIDRLLKRVRVPASDKRDSAQLIEALDELVPQPKETLEAHEEFVAWRERVRHGLAELDAQQRSDHL